MNKEIIKDRWGLLIAFGLILLTGTYGLLVFVLACLVALFHAITKKEQAK